MSGLFATTYDLTDYGSMRIVGIVLSVLVAVVVLAITVVVYLKARRKELAAVGFSSAGGAETSPPVINEITKAGETEAPADAEKASVTDVPEEAGEPQAPAEEEAQEAAQEAPVPEPSAEETHAEQEEATPAEMTGKEAAVIPSLESVPFWEREVAAAMAENIPDTPPAFFDEMLSDLTEEERAEFYRAAIDNPDGLKLAIRRPLGIYAEEKDFLRDFFLSIGKLRSSLPLGAIEKLYLRDYEFMTNDYRRSRLNSKMIGVYYFRRAEDGALDKCEALCKADVALNLDRRKVKLTRLPSLKRLVLIYASKKDYEKALELCEKAVELSLIDKKKEGYEARRDKIAAKLEKQRKREERERKRAERERKRKEKEALAAGRAAVSDTEGVR